MHDHTAAHPLCFIGIRMNKNKNEREIARLEQELRQERRTSAKLRRRVAELHRELEESRQPTSRVPLLPRRKARTKAHLRRAMLSETAATARRFRKRTYFSFLARIVADSSLFEVATRVIAYVRRLHLCLQNESNRLTQTYVGLV